ncbi:MAG: M1 family metallopeptidase [Streptococcaceae bacterium]|jgi:aminopeptidase N|nr:M1 family metallopeptidase [Streptococcaceae bacterium]
MAVKHLIESFVPENYKVMLDIDRQARAIKGQVVVTGEAKDVVVSFHQKDLNIQKVQLHGAEVPFIVNREEDEVVIKLGTRGLVTLTLDYETTLTDNMMGIYPSYYEVDGVKKMLIGTQFESHFARQAFPCIDEPEAKATFDLSVKWDEEPGDLIIANMPEKSVSDGYHTFETTVRMSSYLLAFVFGEMQYKKGMTRSGVEVGAFSTKAHKLEALDFPLEIATKAIEFYENYYQTPYPLPHSWHVALPDFSAGAMENWGCITYREVCMLVDPDNATEASKQYVGTIIAHELAHQWFGDLVTMRWWDDLWLNESFANNMEYVSIDAIHPEWKIWESFSIKEGSLALDRDATDGVQSVHVEVEHPDEIGTLFDPAIVYAKGSRLMVMLRYWLGDAAFAAGLKAYFTKNQYGNTVGDDLWAALSEASGKNVSDFMHSWINQPGYPVVDVTVENDTLVLSQKQFFIGEGVDRGRLWNLPLNSNWTGLPDLLTTDRVEIPGFAQLMAENGNVPLQLNVENMAHYIVNYDAERLSALTENLAQLAEITKYQLLQDRKFLAKGGVISYSELLKLLPYFKGEKSYIVSHAVGQVLADAAVFVDADTAADKDMDAIINQLFSDDYARLGWEKRADESSDDETQRGLVLNKVTAAGNEAAIAKSREIFARHQADISHIPADIRPIVLNTEVRAENSDAIVRDFMSVYVGTSLQQLKREIETAVSYIKNEATVRDLLANFLDMNVVKPQDIPFAWYYLLQRDFTQDAAWAWEKANWQWLAEKLGGDMSYDKFVIYPANVFKTADKLAEYKAFFEPMLENPGLKRAIEMGIKQIETRVALIESQKAAVEATLAEIAAR